MEGSLKLVLEELCINVDTLDCLKEDVSQNNMSMDEVYELFSEDLDYSKELTSALSSLNKSYIRSVYLRLLVKLRRSNNPKNVHQELLKYNSSLKPVLDKFLENSLNLVKEEKVQSKKSTKKVLVEEEEEEEEEEVVEEEDDEEDEVEEETDQNSEVNLLDSFYNSSLKTTTSSEDFVKLSLIHSKFKQWFSNQENTDVEAPEKSDIKSFLNKKLGKSKKGGWTNLRLVE